MRTTRVVALAAASALALAACAPVDEETGDGSTGGYVTEGTLTIATSDPAYEPWVVGDDPASGEGFEAAVAYAVADRLGFAPEDVHVVPRR